jgi:tetratricopeptide (TPR) repeat protein
MKRHLLLLAAILLTTIANAQLTMPADGGSTKGMVGEKIGLTDVTIHYGRPALRGREGKVWGQLVPVGFSDDASLGTPKKIPWRAGANENTTIEFSTDVMIEGKQLPAGKYGFFVAYDPKECTLIFSRHTGGWGSFMYEEADDILRVKVKPQPLTQTEERLSYSFSDQTDSSAIISLSWEKLSIPFTVSTELQKLQLASIDKEMRTDLSFNSLPYLQAARYYISRNIRLEEALQYLNIAANGIPSFNVYSTKADLLEKMGRTEEATKTLKTAVMAATNPNQPHFYARQLLSEQKKEKALMVFRLNYEHFPESYTANMGMVRAMSADGKPKEALKYANKALPLLRTRPIKKTPKS